jgi:imidazolonepropionase-like amidohydrolase
MPDQLLAEVAARGIQVCPTVGADQSRYPPRDRMPPGLRAAFDQLGLDWTTFHTARVEHVARMRAHGVRLVTGTDAGIGPAKAHGGVGFAVLDLVEAGYPVAEALATATSGAAYSCGLGPVTGSLRPRLAADLLVVDGDVAAEPEALLRPVAALVRGVQISRSTGGGACDA